MAPTTVRRSPSSPTSRRPGTCPPEPCSRWVTIAPARSTRGRSDRSPSTRSSAARGCGSGRWTAWASSRCRRTRGSGRPAAARHSSTMNVMTVRGPIAAADLGVTLPHEHLFIDLLREYRGNGLLHDEALAIEEVGAFRDGGWHDHRRLHQRGPRSGPVSAAAGVGGDRCQHRHGLRALPAAVSGRGASGPDVRRRDRGGHRA